MIRDRSTSPSSPSPAEPFVPQRRCGGREIPAMLQQCVHARTARRPGPARTGRRWMRRRTARSLERGAPALVLAGPSPVFVLAAPHEFPAVPAQQIPDVATLVEVVARATVRGRPAGVRVTGGNVSFSAQAASISSARSASLSSGNPVERPAFQHVAGRRAHRNRPPSPRVSISVSVISKWSPTWRGTYRLPAITTGSALSTAMVRWASLRLPETGASQR